MNETMNYIFGKLRESEAVTQCVVRELRRQKRSDKNVMIMAGVAVYFALAAVIEQRKQAEKMEALEKKVKEFEELKRPEGE